MLYFSGLFLLIDFAFSFQIVKTMLTVSLGKKLATHLSILAWENPWAESLVGPWGCKRAGHSATKQQQQYKCFKRVKGKEDSQGLVGAKCKVIKHSFIKSNLMRALHIMGFPGGSDGKESVCNAGDPDSIPGWGRSPGGGHGSPPQCSCLESPMDGGAWGATVPGVKQSQLSD